MGAAQLTAGSRAVIIIVMVCMNMVVDEEGGRTEIAKTQNFRLGIGARQKWTTS